MRTCNHTNRYLYPQLILLLLVAVTACTQPVVMKSPDGYDFSKPVIIALPPELEEVSGIAFRNGNADTLYAEQDEEGILFMLHPMNKISSAIQFGKKGDYEDVGIYKDTVTMLKSNGSFYRFALSAVKEGIAEQVQAFHTLLPEAEYEAMYIDPNDGAVYVLCKVCSADKKAGIIYGYKILFAGNSFRLERFTIDESSIRSRGLLKNSAFKASALGKNPLTGEWYIISSVQHSLVIADSAWSVKAVYALQPTAVFPQPEGIAFDKNNNLYISNEGAGLGAGTVVKFAYHH